MRVLIVGIFVALIVFVNAQTTLIFQDNLTKEPICNVYVEVDGEKTFSDCKVVAVK